MKRIKLIADNNIPFLKGALDPVTNITYYPGVEINAGLVKDADALIIRTRTLCNKKMLSGSRVKFIATATIGYDHIDTGFCESAGIKWTNAPGCNSYSVQQYILSALLEIAFQKDLKLEGMCLGVIGAGQVGSKVASAAKRIGMKVLLNDPPRERQEGGEIFRRHRRNTKVC